jgi:phage FluMu gp28-like protein
LSTLPAKNKKDDNNEEKEIIRKIMESPVAFVFILLGLDPFPYQRDFLGDTSKRIVICAGRRVGKTVMTAARAVWFAYAHPRTSTLIVSATLRQSMLMFDTILDYISNSRRIERSIIRETRTLVKFSNGSKIKALPCVLPNTQITTSAGPKLIRDIHVGEFVLTHRGRFRKVTKVYKNPHKGKLYRFQATTSEKITYDLFITGEHPILSSTHGWIRAKDAFQAVRKNQDLRFVRSGMGVSRGLHRRRWPFFLAYQAHESYRTKTSSQKTAQPDGKDEEKQKDCPTAFILLRSRDRDLARQFSKGTLEMDSNEDWWNLCGPLVWPYLKFCLGRKEQPTGRVALFDTSSEAQEKTSTFGFGSVRALANNSVWWRPGGPLVAIDRDQNGIDGAQFGEPPGAGACSEKQIGEIQISAYGRESYNGPVYNLAVEEDNSYCAGSFILHNCGPYGKSLRGETAHMIILDEAAFMPDNVIAEVVLPMLATTNGTAIMLSTPWTKDHIFYKAFTSNSWSKYHYPTSINPMVSKDFLEEQRELIGEQRFLQEYEAQFSDDGRAYFPSALLRTCLHICSNDVNCEYCELFSPFVEKNLERISKIARADSLYSGYDPGGKGDPAAFVVLEKMKDGVLRVVHVKTYLAELHGKKIEDSNLYTRFTAEIGDIDKKIKLRELWIDETGIGQPIIEQCRALKLPAEGLNLGARSKEELLGNLRILFENKKILLPSGDRDLELKILANLNCIEAERKPAGGYAFSHQNGTHDDIAFALALAAWGATRGGGTVIMMKDQSADSKKASWRQGLST